jgi:nucleotide-binding universal stress UspA family protein
MIFNRILIGLKFTKVGRYALEKAIQLAREQNAHLYILHALDYRLQEFDNEDARRVEETREAQLSFEKEIRPLLGDYEKFDFFCHPGDPGLAICKHARQNEVDLIILGTHQRQKNINLGRIDYVGMTIIEYAPCPVMLVPYAYA